MRFFAKFVICREDCFCPLKFSIEKFYITEILTLVHGWFLSNLDISAAVIFCHTFSVKLFSDNSPRVYCLGHLEVIFRSEIRCIKIDIEQVQCESARNYSRHFIDDHLEN